eukprot:6186960-Pleurochrysis_carterae.AAC.2
MVHSHEIRGIAEPTIANAVRRLSDSLSTLLDVKLSLNSGVGDLGLTISTARSVLSDAEARNMRRELESNPGATHAFVVRGKEDRSKDIRAKPTDPKRPRPEANEKRSNKWAPCRWCKGPHWHKDCPKRRSKGDKQTSKQDRRDSESRATLAAAESADVNPERPP